MLASSTFVTTENALRYKQALAKHFAHKITVHETASDATFHFDAGTGRAAVGTDGLLLEAHAPKAADLETIQSVLESHLKRFAFREPFDRLDWQGCALPAVPITAARS
ncbi:DUF2218 domain-containing protein [Fulvimarina sp. 2208YS6-2-32]|uniref:DUF2218 domain-containing protein n=1 Tax=Fulvimarina uroteuthidis TaxID=3098149 RepID=A0ABU5I6J2_9HYPH|nr:DUF2218 domain-containing protein [Fulvimarina sp. 2208YS6-2-32]MDY8110831.1 DUF2218 domain-containing protein [Fulvimarina sp. 2208YS6-2-32]